MRFAFFSTNTNRTVYGEKESGGVGRQFEALGLRVDDLLHSVQEMQKSRLARHPAFFEGMIDRFNAENFAHSKLLTLLTLKGMAKSPAKGRPRLQLTPLRRSLPPPNKTLSLLNHTMLQVHTYLEVS